MPSKIQIQFWTPKIIPFVIRESESCKNPENTKASIITTLIITMIEVDLVPSTLSMLFTFILIYEFQVHDDCSGDVSFSASLVFPSSFSSMISASFFYLLSFFLSFSTPTLSTKILNFSKSKFLLLSLLKLKLFKT